MPPREVRYCPHHHNAQDAIADDILDHTGDTTYDVLCVPPHDTKYLYHVTCDDLTTVPKDRPQLYRLLIQATHEAFKPRNSENPGANFFPEPQPIKIERVPRQQSA